MMQVSLRVSLMIKHPIQQAGCSVRQGAPWVRQGVGKSLCLNCQLRGHLRSELELETAVSWVVECLIMAVSAV